jgi:hypothetical protein
MFDTLTIPLGRNASLGTIEVDTEAFSPVVQRHIYEYGLRQILNDACANKKDEEGNLLPDDFIVAKAHARLKNLYDGVLRARGEVAPSDPIEKIVRDLAREAIAAKWRVAGKWTFPKGTKNRFLFVANAVQTEAGKPIFDSESDYLDAALKANPKMRDKYEKQAREILSDDFAGVV